MTFEVLSVNFDSSSDKEFFKKLSLCTKCLTITIGAGTYQNLSENEETINSSIVESLTIK